MLAFSDDTAWVRSDNQKDPLYMSIPIVLKLAVIHHYAIRTFSYISLPVEEFESQLIDYRFVYIANTDVHHSDVCDPGDPPRDMVMLALTVAGQEFLKKIPSVRLVVELIDHQFSPYRSWRWYPYSVSSDNVYEVAETYMECLDASELPQFLSHEISTIREKASELLLNAESATTCKIS